MLIISIKILNQAKMRLMLTSDLLDDYIDIEKMGQEANHSLGVWESDSHFEESGSLKS